MKVRITFDLSTDEVAAIAHYYGNPRADRESVRRFIETNLHATLEGLVAEAQENTFCPRCGELAASEVECPHRCHRLSTLAAKVQATTNTARGTKSATSGSAAAPRMGAHAGRLGA